MSGIQVKNLYKIFGDNPQDALKHVMNGVGKAELLDKHGHVLGLQDINIDMPDQKWDLLRILDIHGRLIKVVPNSGNLNISELENGIYVVQLEGQFGTTIGRLVKQ